MTTTKTITQAMQLLLTNFSMFKITTDKIKLWEEILSDIDSELVLTACLNLVASHDSQYPPSLALVRKTAILLRSGKLTQISAPEAWGHVLKKIANKNFKLSDLEKSALKNVGDIYSLRKKNDLSFDRNFFIQSFNSELAKKIAIVTAPASVRRAITSKANRMVDSRRLIGDSATHTTQYDGTVQNEHLNRADKKTEKLTRDEHLNDIVNNLTKTF